MNFILIRALILCSFSWISVLVSHDVKVQSGLSVTLLCPNTSTLDTVTAWFRVVNSTNASCIALMTRSYNKPKFCDGFQNRSFEMETNLSTVFLKIKQVDLSDSGLYFCQFFFGGRAVYNVIHLTVEGSDEFQDDEDRKSKKCETTNLLSLILGALTVFLVLVVIGLAVTIKDQKPPQHENLDCDELKPAALSLYSTTLRSRRKVETRVIYAAQQVDSEWN
ncbi:uncharacterized protein LOC113157248 isoform X2 [Anabas testudineus]|uniref:uncharacterized protein LOC113157248 isoform X2 n=1 Tax=Anabas testudineus TaxID=64144 RepID=UPI000E456FD2|nr:uncharacterized protein LOC113157248 isoform X2 [Anabas testudineus]